MNSLALNALRMNGGKGSGNFGHKGRPGIRGGSGDGKGGTASVNPKGGSTKASGGSSKLSKTQAEKVAKVGRSVGSATSELDRDYSELARTLGEWEEDYAQEFGDDEDFGDDSGLRQSQEAFGELEELVYDLKSVKEKHDTAMSKASTVEETSKALADTDKAIGRLQEKYSREMEIADILLHPGETLDNIKDEIASAQKALKEEE